MQDPPSPLRTAHAGDARDCAKLLRQLECVAPGAELAVLEERLDAFLRRPSATRLVVLGAPVQALAVVHVLDSPADGPQLYVHDLVVDASARGQGLGQVLLKGLQAWATLLGAGVVQVRLDDGNPSDGLFRRNGFADADVLLEWRPGAV